MSSEFEARVEALRQANMLARDGESPHETVKRAEAYLGFLNPGYAHREMQKKNAPIPVAAEPVSVDTRPVARTEHNEWR